MSIRTAVLGACILWLTAAPATAQPAVPKPALPQPATTTPTEWRDRAFLNVNLGFQMTDRPFDEAVTPIIYGERASVAATHPVAGKRLTLDIGGGVRLWRSLGVGGALTKFSSEETSTVVARVPHPTLFNQPRLASKDAPFNRKESAIHIDAVYVKPITPRVDVMVAGGPSILTVTQDLLQRIDVAEGGPPFTTVGIGNVAKTTRDVRTYGFHVGGDVTWFVTPLVGIGVGVRYVMASLSTTLTDGTTPIDIDAGGLQIGWGARIRLR